jgi:hypothetical protein
MDTVIKQLERLAEIAAARQDPMPLDAGGVMMRIRGLDTGVDMRESLPIRFFAGGAAAVAAAAAFAAIIGVRAWQEIANPGIVPIESLVTLDSFFDLVP